MQASQGLGSVPTSSGVTSPTLKPSATDNSNVSATAHNEPVASKISAEDAKQKALEAEIDPTGKLFAGKDAKTRAKLVKDYSLKKALQAKLAAADRAEHESAEASAAAGAASKVSKDNPANKVTQAFLDGSLADNSSGSGGVSNSHFSLSNSETNAEVKRMISTLEDKGQNQAANDLKAGILETESATLFERVKDHINTCLRQRCVISLYTHK
ncbi:MAG: hypothetical protein ACXWQO_18250 [Bdellovibrionota bacterium]